MMMSPMMSSWSLARGVARALLAGAACAMLGAVALVAAHVRLNTSPSIPRGLYRDAAAPVTHGAIVVACLPRDAAPLARARRYVGRGTCPGGTAPVGKHVLALAGDTVAFTPAGMRVNGRLAPASAPRARDHHGRPLVPYPFETVVVRPGMLVLYAPSPQSFDSRYYGPVARRAVRAVIRPLWTWGGPPSVAAEAHRSLGVAPCDGGRRTGTREDGMSRTAWTLTVRHHDADW